MKEIQNTKFWNHGNDEISIISKNFHITNKKINDTKDDALEGNGWIKIHKTIQNISESSIILKNLEIESKCIISFSMRLI